MNTETTPSTTKINTNILTEKCVSCGAETNVPVTQHVDFRMFYIEGAGQCCKECFEKTSSKFH